VCFQLRVIGDGCVEARNYPALADEVLSYSIRSNLIKKAIESSSEDTQVRIIMRTSHEFLISINNFGKVPEDVLLSFLRNTTCGKRSSMGIGTYSARLRVKTMGGDVAMDT